MIGALRTFASALVAQSTWLTRAPLAVCFASCIGCMGHPSPLVPGLGGSVGAPHNGVLTEAAELPAEGAGYVRYRPKGTANFGLPRLVEGLEAVAQNVAFLAPGPRLVIGDLSAETGGRVPRHNSHRTGRDVDLLLYVMTPEGVPVESPGFVHLDADGFTRLPDGRYLRLDIRRQWLLVRELLRSTALDVQFLFISRDLEALIIDYALAVESDWALIWAAETVMLQPGDSLPHTDHIHMRIACRPVESVAGCLGGGPRWPWLEPFPVLGEDFTSVLQNIAEQDPFLDPSLTPTDPAEAEAFVPRGATAGEG